MQSALNKLSAASNFLGDFDSLLFINQTKCEMKKKIGR